MLALRRILFGGLLWLSLAAPASSQAGAGAELPLLRLACVSEPQHADFQYAEQLYNRVFQPLGYRVELFHASLAQTLTLLRNGEADGDCGRLSGFEQQIGWPELQRVGAPVRQVFFKAVSTSDLSAGQLFAASPRAELRVGYRDELVVLPSALRAMGFGKLHAFADTDAGLAALRANQLDLFVNYAEALDKHLLRSGSWDRYNLTPLLSIPVYLYLHPRHQALVAPVAAALADAVHATPYRSPDAGPPTESPRRFNRRLVFSCSAPAFLPMVRTLEQKIRQALASLGYDFEMVFHPSARGTAELLAGRIDGSCGRTQTFLDIYADQLVKVPVTAALLSYQAWTGQPGQELAQTIGRTPAPKVGYLHGTEILQQALGQQGMQALPVITMESGMKMLAAGRLDFYVDFSASIEAHIANLNIDRPMYLAGIALEVPIFPVLHGRHKALAEPLARQLETLLLPPPLSALTH